jgi:para-nitrobenzyl esterase
MDEPVMTLRQMIAIAAAALLSACAASAQQSAGGNPIVKTPAGAVSGLSEGGLNAFKGIPYAAPPVGEARWKPPAPLAPWSGVKQANDFGAACIQPVSRGNIYASDIGALSEDCLTLNVWTPANAKKAPVFVWIHGGALRTGSSKESLYEGARLAREGLVVVSINYRLGVLGYFAHPELSAESKTGVSGNYGLLDQIEALRWIKRNIASFGGDPDNVTIAGESAGGLSVMYLLASPQAKNLYAKAVAQSAYMISTPELKQNHHGEIAAEATGTRIAAALKASSITDLRAMDAAKLDATAGAAGFAPFGVVDGQVLTRQLVDTFDRGEQARVPLMAGFNSGEIRSLTMLAPPLPKSAEDYERVIRERYGDLAGDFLKVYPAGNMQETMFAVSRDALYGWTAERLAKKQAAAGAPSYLYLFDHSYPTAEEAKLHAHHASELPYMFGNLTRTPPLWPTIPATSAETTLSNQMVSYWASFAKTGKPVAAGAPDWPAYGAGGAYMLFQDTPKASGPLMPGMYALHEQVVCRRFAAGTVAWNWNAGTVSPPLPPKGNC